MWSRLRGRSWKGISSTGARTEPSTTRATLTPVLNDAVSGAGMVGFAPGGDQRMREREKLQRSERRLKELLEQQNAIRQRTAGVAVVPTASCIVQPRF